MKKKNILIIVLGVLIAAAVLILSLNLYRSKQPYYKKYHYIAHALGGIDHRDYTNSKEALELSYANGYRLMEVDFLYTSDGYLVCRHNWNNNLEDGFSKENIPNYNTFMKSKMYGKYTTLDIADIIQFAMDHPDVYFVTDFKSYTYDICDAIEALQNTVKKMGYQNLNNQFVFQCYSYEDYERINQRFSFNNYILTLYRMKDILKEENGMDEIVDFCVKNNIKVVTLPKKYATYENCKKLKAKGIQVYSHTINSLKEWIELRKIGVDGIYTDYISPLLICKLLIIGVVGFFLLIIIIFLSYQKILAIKKKR